MTVSSEYNNQAVAGHSVWIIAPMHSDAYILYE